MKTILDMHSFLAEAADAATASPWPNQVADLGRSGYRSTLAGRHAG